MNDQSFGALTRNVATIFKQHPSYLISEFTRLFSLLFFLSVIVADLFLAKNIDCFAGNLCQKSRQMMKNIEGQLTKSEFWIGFS